MQYKNIKDTSLIVSSVALGTAVLGSAVDERESLRILDKYYGCGGTFIDTAVAYGSPAPGVPGAAELVIGKWLKQSHLRDKVIVLSKGGRLGATSVKELREQIQGSLRNMHLDYLDAFCFHHDNLAVAPGELVENANILIKEGLMRYVGCSNWRADRMREAVEYAHAHGLAPFTADECSISLGKPNYGPLYMDINRVMTKAIYDFHCASKVPVLSYTAQASGIFSAYDRSDFMTSPKFQTARKNFLNDITRSRIARVKALAQAKGATTTQIVLGYLQTHPFQIIPIIGPHTVAELQDSLDGNDYSLTKEEADFLVDGQDFYE